MNKLLTLLFLGGAVAAAQAHLVLEYQAAPAARSYQATFKTPAAALEVFSSGAAPAAHHH